MKGELSDQKDCNHMVKCSRAIKYMSILKLNFREAEILQKRKEYEARLLRERKEYNAEAEEQRKKEEKEEKELKQWILLQGLRREEIDKLHEIKRKELDWAGKMIVREGYNKQIVSFISDRLV